MHLYVEQHSLARGSLDDPFFSWGVRVFEPYDVLSGFELDRLGEGRCFAVFSVDEYMCPGRRNDTQQQRFLGGQAARLGCELFWLFCSWSDRGVDEGSRKGCTNEGRREGHPVEPQGASELVLFTRAEWQCGAPLIGSGNGKSKASELASEDRQGGPTDESFQGFGDFSGVRWAFRWQFF